MSYENKNFGDSRGDSRNESLYSKRIKAGKRRTYFFDVRSTRGNDYFITITESKKRFDDNGYDRHKMFLYKEDFNKFLAALTDTINYVKTDLMPDFDFDAFNHDHENEEGHEHHESGSNHTPASDHTPADTHTPTSESNGTTTPSTIEIKEGSSVDDWKI